MIPREVSCDITTEYLKYVYVGFLRIGLRTILRVRLKSRGASRTHKNRHAILVVASCWGRGRNGRSQQAPWETKSTSKPEKGYHHGGKWPSKRERTPVVFLLLFRPKHDLYLRDDYLHLGNGLRIRCQPFVPAMQAMACWGDVLIALWET